MTNWRVRVAGILLLVATAWYLPWAAAHLNRQVLWLSLPFAAASLLTVALTLVTVVNHWRYAVPEERRVPPGEEPLVLVIIPTCGESPRMVYDTARSVLGQDYPQEKIGIVISDDASSERMRFLALRLARKHPRAYVDYHEPPAKGDPARQGEAKAGNLNSAWGLLRQRLPEAEFVETRDADDRVGDPSFLRQTVGQLLADPGLAFVQTMKDVIVSKADPFGNREPLFYQRAMLAKNAANAVFPCGSGLVWRRRALEEIGGFPAWNLVEDLQSGIEALRRGWRGLFLPIVGAVAQAPPEDIPNSAKQRGTWALDTMRLAFWGRRQGLSLRQHLQFGEMGLFYLFSFAVLIFALVPVIALTLGIYPLVTDHLGYALHFWPYAAAVELLLASLAAGLPYEDLWRSRQTWLGMAPVYARATIMALAYGPRRKPAYRVTRKEHRHAWYWRQTLVQSGLLLALLAASVYHLATHSPLLDADLGSLFWAGFFMLELSRTVRNSWYGAVRPAAALDALRRVVYLLREAVPADASVWVSAQDDPPSSTREEQRQ